MLCDSDQHLISSLSALSPFIRRAGIIVTGREKLIQRSNQLAFAVMTADLSDASRREALRDLKCKVFELPLNSDDIEKLYGVSGAKLLGFKKNKLADSILKFIKPYQISAIERSNCLLMPRHPKVAILGASGIGRFHAAWWGVEGVEVVAFLGSSQESLERTSKLLAEALPQQQQPPVGYTDLAQLLSESKPDIVDVCLPDVMHYQACKTALAAGCHLLCEKPICYDPALTTQQLLAQLDELIELAQANNCLFGLSTQYFALAQTCRRLMNSSEPIRTISAQLYTPLKQRPKGPEEAWIDLGPHLLAMIQGIIGHRQVQKNTLHWATSGSSIKLCFQCAFSGDKQDTSPVECQLEACHYEEVPPPPNQRILKLNETTFDCRGSKDKNGLFCMDLFQQEKQQSNLYPDFLHSLIHDFKRGKVVIFPAIARKNLELLLEFRDIVK